MELYRAVMLLMLSTGHQVFRARENDSDMPEVRTSAAVLKSVPEAVISVELEIVSHPHADPCTPPEMSVRNGVRSGMISCEAIH